MADKNKNKKFAMAAVIIIVVILSAVILTGVVKLPTFITESRVAPSVKSQGEAAKEIVNISSDVNDIRSTIEGITKDLG